MTETNSALEPETAKSQKDLWDKFEIISRPMAAFFTAIVIALIGYFGQSILTELSNQEQKALTQLSLQEQNARLYTELLARREDAESSLRKDMFTQIMGGFFKEPTQEDINNELSKKVLKLELLALNFGDSLSLGPLFSEMSRDIERQFAARIEQFPDWKTDAAVYQSRLRSLAKRVANSQLSTIYPKAKTFAFEVPVGETEIQDFVYRWPDDANHEDVNANVRTLDDVKRSFLISFKNVDNVQKSVQVKLEIEEYRTEQKTEIPEKKTKENGNQIEKEEILYVFDKSGKPVLIEKAEKVTDLEFTLDFFNFPLIDNTRLSHNHRFTLILEKFDQNTISLNAMVFPGLYASQRDKPFLNEAIQELTDQQGLESN